MVSTKAARIYCACSAVLFLFFFKLPAFSTVPALPSGHVAEDREATARKFVTHELEVWQKRLDLAGWDLQVELVHRDSLEPKTLGDVHWNLDTRQATIGVLSSDDYALPTPEMLDDMEVTIVHELVHIHLAVLPRNSASRNTEERVVNELTHALLNLAKHQD